MPSDRLIHALLSDPGRVRTRNEDAAAAAAGLGAYVVCDGMGGAAAGEIASRMAVDTFLEHLAGSAPTVAGADAAAVKKNGTFQKPQTRLHAAVHAANEAVFRLSADTTDLSGMGTTLVGLLHVPGPTRERRLRPRGLTSRFIAPPTLFLANVGDSRCYRRRSGELLQLSTDHSFVEEQVLAGQITADQAAVSPMRNYITRAVGPQLHVEPDVQSYRPLDGDLYLLASDGLTRELENEQVAAVLRDKVPAVSPTVADLQAACGALIEAANAHGGRDNITVLLVAFV